jgi:hypothetical protein
MIASSRYVVNFFCASFLSRVASALAALARLLFFLRLLVREPSNRIASRIKSLSFIWLVPGGAFFGGLRGGGGTNGGSRCGLVLKGFL